MLNVTPIRGNNQYAAAHYFSAADDYYTKDEHGHWQGKGAEELGLTGAVDQAEFSRLLAGILPNGERIMSLRTDDESKRRMGLDLTFSAPKSVSMQALIAGDTSVTQAHDKAVALALRHVEELAAARKKIGGKSMRERTGNMVIGKFRHEMSRAKDPQLHTHAIVLNMTKRKDGLWRALVNDDIFKVQHELDAIYKNELAKELQANGYHIRVTDDNGGFELSHISREQIELFSARSLIIEEALAKEGKSRQTATTLEKQIISLATRPRKDERDREYIKEWWVEKSREAGIHYDKTLSPDGQHPVTGTTVDETPQGFTPAEAIVDYAIRHLTERECVVTESDLVSTALKRAVGLVDSARVREEILRREKQGSLIPSAPTYMASDNSHKLALSQAGWVSYLCDTKGWNTREASRYVRNAVKRGSLIEAEKRYTTHEGLKRERAILAIERTGRGAVTPIVARDQVKAALELSSMNAGQKAAATMMVSTPNRFVGIQGDAGTGKTYTVNQAVDMVREAGKGAETPWRTLALAPYGNQVKALKGEGLEAHTLASFLHTRNKPIDDRTLVILDEGAVTGARQMEQVMRIVEKHGARMVILGDTKQTEAIEAGKPFAQLQAEGMETVRIHEIQRQIPPELKASVEKAAAGNMRGVLSHLESVAELPDAMQRYAQIVSDYTALEESARHKTLIVAGTNAARREINGMMRSSLGLTGKGKEFTLLSRVDLTQAQRRFAPSYRMGMVIQPNRSYPKAGLVRDETYYVRQAKPGNLLVLADSAGNEVIINPRTQNQLSVYTAEKAELSVGDSVRINRNNPALDLTNGDRMRVTAITGQTITIESVDTTGHHEPRKIDLSGVLPMHLEHAYASTVHSAQGLTNDRVLIDLDTRSRTTSMNLFYVAISRARYEVQIYTDKIASLPDAISRQFTKTTALDLQREKRMQAGQYRKIEKEPQTREMQPEAPKKKEYGAFG